MIGTVVILGAKGRFGRNAVSAFKSAGWNVIAAGRNLDGLDYLDGIDVRDCDLSDRASTVAACADADVIVHAVHPPYTEWAKLTPIFTANVIAAARASQATVMIPGNIYSYGASMPRVLNETTPHHPTTKKGTIRLTMEQTFKAANDIQTIILRAGDFFEGVDTGNWLESHMLNKVNDRVMTYPGPMGHVHAWAYLPDMARAMVGLAEARQTLQAFEEFGFDGYSLTGWELKEQVEAQLGSPVKVKRIPWGLMRILGWFQPLIREVMEMRYLWTTPHQIDGQKLRSVLPDFQPTRIEDAIAATVS